MSFRHPSLPQTISNWPLIWPGRLPPHTAQHGPSFLTFYSFISSKITSSNKILGIQFFWTLTQTHPIILTFQ